MEEGSSVKGFLDPVFSLRDGDKSGTILCGLLCTSVLKDVLAGEPLGAGSLADAFKVFSRIVRGSM